jgi:hypothetical protein
VDAAGDIFAPDGIELSPAGQPFATATAATIVATSGGNAGIVDPNTAVQGQAILPNAQVVTGLGLSFGRGIVGVQAELDNADNSTVTGFFNPTFQFSGATVSKPGSIPAAVAVQANGQIVIAGTNSAGGFGGTSTFGLARLTATGSLDTAFGSNGVLTTSFQGNDHVVAVLIRPGNGDPFPFPPTARPSRPPRQTGRTPSLVGQPSGQCRAPGARDHRDGGQDDADHHDDRLRAPDEPPADGQQASGQA